MELRYECQCDQAGYPDVLLDCNYSECACIRELDTNDKTVDDVDRQYVDEITKEISDLTVSEHVG